jgi:tripartite-type tricarboxylate transporter receptor subunit TctC
MLRRAIIGMGAVALATASAVPALPDAPYPTRLITVVAPFPAGGAGDLLSRLIAEHLRHLLSQPIIVENKTGASGNIGAESVSRAQADGSTLLTAPQLTFSVNHLLNPNLRFDPSTMEPISVLATYPFVLFSRADLPVSSLSELIA